VPWKETRIVDQRIDFIAAVRQDPRGNFTRLCERFGISRQTGYALIRRLHERGAGGLEDGAPVAKHCPHKTSAEMEDRVIAMRKLHPLEGPKKLRDRMLALEPELAVPAASTVGDILQRRGQIRLRMQARSSRAQSPMTCGASTSRDISRSATARAATHSR
jgi:transposase